MQAPIDTNLFPCFGSNRCSKCLERVLALHLEPVPTQYTVFKSPRRTFRSTQLRSLAVKVSTSTLKTLKTHNVYLTRFGHYFGRHPQPLSLSGPEGRPVPCSQSVMNAGRATFVIEGSALGSFYSKNTHFDRRPLCLRWVNLPFSSCP